MRRVCVPERNWLTTRPVVRKIGYSSSSVSTGGAIVGDVEARLAVGEIERPGAFRDRVVAAGLEQPRRARVIGRRLARLRIVAVARPEDADLLLDLLVGDAGVVGDAALADATRSSSKISRGLSNVKPCARPSARAMSWMMRQSCARLAGTVDGLVDLDDAPFDLRDVALVLLLQAAGQDDVGVARGVVQEEVDGDEELELVERARRRTRCRAARPSG